VAKGVCDPGRPFCRHGCGRRAKVQRRGLCPACADDPVIGALYPSTSKYGRRGVGRGLACGRPPGRPVTDPPGSPGKIDAMARRARRGQDLFHPEDSP
jgi:hypothetical protein